MELYIFILVVLFGTALADLIVGVSNDAVNFLNSAIGSKVASRKIIMIIAALGVLFGTTFSSGMMEVARKGIFNPEYYVMHEVMIIFLAVMLTDILLLDLYNTFGLPTSTTVSIVFEIFGGAVAIAAVKVWGNSEGLSLLSHINTKNVITIISGIGLSVVFAFIFGSLIQFITRLIFTFEYQKTFKRYGSIYCGIALTAITFFIMIKGAKGSSLITPETRDYILSHQKEFLAFSFIGWTIVWQMIITFTKINVLKIIVLIGTFALALAFAANDLVNFIGAPLGALTAFKIGNAAGTDPFVTTMEALANPVRANTWILLVAGLVMVVTLWKSKKARSVTKTEVSLGRQDIGVERFESSVLARGIVRMMISLSDIIRKIIPSSVQDKISERINPEKADLKPAADGEVPAFDMLRAAVNLMVASALVSFGTSLKLPLSTTFVTFMVAMSTSLSDKSWGRESAVYRVTGVLTVLGGWFFTAFMAFSTCFLFSLFIYFVKLPAILILVAAAAFIVYRSAKIHRRREKDFTSKEKRLYTILAGDSGLTSVLQEMAALVTDVNEISQKGIDAMNQGRRKKLRNLSKDARGVSESVDSITEDLFRLMKSYPDEDMEMGPCFAKNIGFLQVISTNLNSLATKGYSHIDNNHKTFDDVQREELSEVQKKFEEIMLTSSKKLREGQFTRLDELTEKLTELKDLISKYDRTQMKRLKSGVTKSRLSLLFVSTMSKIERIAENTVNLLKLYDK
ncbi:MAG: inorganic phosphate transporter [candidate division KSB1 bacterium]|jgi:phosphate/sulfate permease|nr:inorganic phosphate transporter [candidate division KSB1 bacterium]